jgi:serine/threonine-protein kinase RsbW
MQEESVMSMPVGVVAGDLAVPGGLLALVAGELPGHGAQVRPAGPGSLEVTKAGGAGSILTVPESAPLEWECRVAGDAADAAVILADMAVKGGVMTVALRPETAAPLNQTAMETVRQFRGKLGMRGNLAGLLAASPGENSQVFPGKPDQVRAVRGFVRQQLLCHAACDDSVLVASELATNSIRHSLSGRDGGAFLVHAAALDSRDAMILVTDQGGSGLPRESTPGPGAESGRGLAVARSLTSVLEFSQGSGLRSALAIIPGGQR